MTVLPSFPRILPNFDLPKDAYIQSWSLMDGDLIVLATDGFWDNMYDTEIVKIIEKNFWDVPGPRLTQRLAQCGEKLVDTAVWLSKDNKRISPWAQMGRAEGMNVIGG